jgi:hypothetical protein
MNGGDLLRSDLHGFWARRPRVRGPIVHDARVAALRLAHGVEKLLTRDWGITLGTGQDHRILER